MTQHPPYIEVVKCPDVVAVGARESFWDEVPFVFSPEEERSKAFRERKEEWKK